MPFKNTRIGFRQIQTLDGKRFNNSCSSCLMKEAVWCQNKPSGSCFCGCSIAPQTVWCVAFLRSLKWQSLLQRGSGRALFSSSSSFCLTLFSLVSFCQWLQKMVSTYWTWQPRLTPLPTTSARPSGAMWSSLRPSAGRRTLR